MFRPDIIHHAARGRRRADLWAEEDAAAAAVAEECALARWVSPPPPRVDVLMWEPDHMVLAGFSSNRTLCSRTSKTPSGFTVLYVYCTHGRVRSCKYMYKYARTRTRIYYIIYNAECVSSILHITLCRPSGLSSTFIAISIGVRWRRRVMRRRWRVGYGCSIYHYNIIWVHVVILYLYSIYLFFFIFLIYAVDSENFFHATHIMYV